MKGTLITTVFTFTIASAALAQSEASRLAPQKGWLTDLGAARLQAQKTGKPMLVVFRCDL